ncbi:hypothetical protein SBA4_710007 [Candidatus Sulfopaludibacter sp. SbA4]|nr:hypothetical protein SBA4_710007 [Candidatus Sulfopaludibacter sp. SbA4]
MIRGEADVPLSHDCATGEYRESLAIVLDGSRRLSRLVDAWSNLARADAEHVRLTASQIFERFYGAYLIIYLSAE